jgi:hypothetical protein
MLLLAKPNVFEEGKYKPVPILPVKFNDGFVAEPAFNVRADMLEIDADAELYTLVPSQTKIAEVPEAIETVEPPPTDVLTVKVYAPVVLFVIEYN